MSKVETVLKPTKIVIVTNILSPYRKFFYDLLFKTMKEKGSQLTVLVMAKTEANRKWDYDDYSTEYTRLLEGKSLNLPGHIFFHFNKGIKAVLKELKPDIVVAAGGYTLPTIMRVVNLQRSLKYKMLFWSESHLSSVKNHNGLTVFIRETIRKSFYKKFDAFWSPGKLADQFIFKYSNPKAKTIFVPNLVDGALYFECSRRTIDEKKNIREKYKIPEDRFVFFCPARLSAEKGLENFLKLFNKTQSIKKCTLIVAGDGEQKEMLLKLIASLGSNDIRLLGNKDSHEMLDLYAIADCFLMPSLSDANPLTCIEALWSGLPILVSNHVGNYPEAVKVGENGYVFSYEEENEAIKLIDLVVNSNEKRRKSASTISQTIAKELYSPAENVSRLIDETLKVFDVSNTKGSGS